jgi:hypothetical protein
MRLVLGIVTASRCVVCKAVLMTDCLRPMTRPSSRPSDVSDVTPVKLCPFCGGTYLLGRTSRLQQSVVGVRTCGGGGREMGESEEAMCSSKRWCPRIAQRTRKHPHKKTRAHRHAHTHTHTHTHTHVGAHTKMDTTYPSVTTMARLEPPLMVSRRSASAASFSLLISKTRHSCQRVSRGDCSTVPQRKEEPENEQDGSQHAPPGRRYCCRVRPRALTLHTESSAASCRCRK